MSRVKDYNQNQFLPAGSQLPAGVQIVPLTTHKDERGALTEIFRSNWIEPVRNKQWNYVKSKANVLRGIHVHVVHHDFLVFLSGKVLLGLQDLRPLQSASINKGCVLPISGDTLIGIAIPPGVAHGFYHMEDSLHVYGVDQFWDINDELGCHYSDPELTIPWQIENPLLSDRDAQLPSLKELKAQLAIHWQPKAHSQSFRPLPSA